MDSSGRAQHTHFSQPLSQIVSMLLVLALVAFGVRLVAPKVAPVFLANPYFNGFIGFVFVIGVLTCFWQVYQVAGSVRWVEGFVSSDPARSGGRAPRLLAPLATLLSARPGMMRISANASRSILDSVATRIDEARDITRYIVNLLIFLGLLGTFYGLATTVPALVETIRSLAPREGEAGLDVFNRLMGGLEGQLDGMGVAFASSLLGLAGSLVVGLLELFAGHGQNRFYRELEEWLSTITRVGFSSGDGEGAVDTAGLARALEHLAGYIDTLQAHHGQSAEAGLAMQERMGRLSEAIEVLAGHLDTSSEADAALTRIADGQERLIAALERGGGPNLAPLVERQDRMIALLERAATSPELSRVAEGQARLVALLEQRTGVPELERIAEGQTRVIALLEERPGSPELERIAACQARMVALMEDVSRSPELARIAEDQSRAVALLEERTGARELRQIAEAQARVVALMEEAGGSALDAESRLHLRSIDAQLLRIIEEMAAGRQEAVDDLRGELAQLSRLIRQLSSGRRQEAPTPIVGRGV